MKIREHRPLDEVLPECRIRDDKNLVILPLDKGSPPPWYPAFAGVEGIYVPREQFDMLKKLRYKLPCEHCPDKLTSNCTTFQTSTPTAKQGEKP